MILRLALLGYFQMAPVSLNVWLIGPPLIRPLIPCAISFGVRQLATALFCGCTDWHWQQLIDQGASKLAHSKDACHRFPNAEKVLLIGGIHGNRVV